MNSTKKIILGLVNELLTKKSMEYKEATKSHKARGNLEEYYLFTGYQTACCEIYKLIETMEDEQWITAEK